MLKKPPQGFTAIEMLITISILGILATIAAPSFKNLLINAQIRTAAQGLTDGIQLARAEAIRLNQPTVFTKGTQSSWTVTVVNGGATLQSRPHTEGSTVATVAVTPNAATKITFNSLGRVIANADASAPITRLDIDAPTSSISAADSKELRIIVTGGGAVRLCDPNGTTGVGMGC